MGDDSLGLQPNRRLLCRSGLDHRGLRLAAGQAQPQGHWGQGDRSHQRKKSGFECQHNILFLMQI